MDIAVMRMPTPDDNWSKVYEVIHETVNDWIGETKISAEPVRRGGDVSLMPTSDEMYDPETGDYVEPSTWDENDTFGELIVDGYTGNTIATYTSGMGFRSEGIREVLQDKVQDSIENLFLEINSIDSSRAVDFDFEPYLDDLYEMTVDVLYELTDLTLKSVLSTSGRKVK